MKLHAINQTSLWMQTAPRRCNQTGTWRHKVNITMPNLISEGFLSQHKIYKTCLTSSLPHGLKQTISKISPGSFISVPEQRLTILIEQSKCQVVQQDGVLTVTSWRVGVEQSVGHDKGLGRTGEWGASWFELLLDVIRVLKKMRWAGNVARYREFW
jgi:hypothetical protein